ncbi:ead/Ea22-like family protein [Pseudomonas asiatica]|uniref:ead/Ea22-like family protein n=1 Tax=Pseudomonas asiatica TaxID=2219225 RepID=UPI001375179F|nr:ead/Ea22-like family protein [Pseudomonas asiatica]
MTIDKAKLKALAQRATPGQWVTEGEYINEHGHLLYAYVAHENSGMIAEAFANCRVKTDDECRGNAAFIAGANPANILALLSEIDALHDRAAYWRQRAKSAEGHLYSADFQIACDELHKVSNYADIPPKQLSEVQKARIGSAVHAVLRAVNAQRDRRRPADLIAYRDELAGKVICDLDLFEDLRDSAAEEAEQHRQYMANYRPQRQQTLDEIVKRCDALIAAVTVQRDNQNLTRQASDQSND